MNIIDISWPITPDITQYKDRKEVTFTKSKVFENDGVRSSSFSLGSHTGTHVDAPSHFLKDGKNIEQVLLEQLCGFCNVLDLTSVNNSITAADLSVHEINQGDIVLLKTTNSQLPAAGPFEYDFVYLEKSGAQYLVDKKIKAVGIDYLGVERNQPAHETHETLLQNDIPIIEGIKLGQASPGTYTLWCLPLNIIGLEAAPARAILISD